MTTLPLAEVKNHLSKLVDSAQKTHERIEVTKNGRRAAVILSAEDYDGLLETLDILSSPETMAALREAEADTTRYSRLEVEQAMREAGRLRA